MKDKNIAEILGHPVIYYPAYAARHAREIDDWFCSSDDARILDTAYEAGYKRIVRPAELALPSSQHYDTILHALDFMKSGGAEPDILVVLLANNVAVRAEWIDSCVKMMKADKSITAVVPVYEDNDHHPLRAKVLSGEGTLEMYEKNAGGQISTNRQDLPKCYFLAHNFWVLNVGFIRSGKEGQQPWGFMGNRIVPFFIDGTADIHTDADLIKAEAWICRNRGSEIYG